VAFSQYDSISNDGYLDTAAAKSKIEQTRSGFEVILKADLKHILDMTER
jgi:hypothetical protein